MTLLVGEVALVASLRAFGWYDTGGGLRWIGCLIAAILPLVAALGVFVCQRLRFNLRTMLVATALVATFLYITVRPLHNAVSSRRASRSMLTVGASLHLESSWDSVYKRLKYDPRPATASPPVNPELPFWLRPLAGSLLTIPTNESVRVIGLNSDEQVFALCRLASEFRNLEKIAVGSTVTSDGTDALKQALPTLTHLTDLHLDVDVQNDWFRTLPNICTLVLWAEGPTAGRTLSAEQLRDIAALPDLRILEVFRYAVTDAEAQTLASSKTLRHVILIYTGVTEAGRDQLSATMPDCTVYRD